ncbi:carcinoembryonic antigen-related cell adhesion molecule 3-like isoform X2 [Erpetoichthys calabaricus]|uniref:carcinoembryonic antigen-related cell adhesion molecule 3-like isoform X2 n=1 Tax=Erpetoichthys calabaricus TaxID=27687 RepID=UPI00109FE71D|nr:carcinoembryonic antigen-related cell adhesion molecule 3-like isoform X2 [Erpetoichthys calabaricus]
MHVYLLLLVLEWMISSFLYAKATTFSTVHSEMGNSLILHLEKEVQEKQIHEITWKKDKAPLAKLKNGTLHSNSMSVHIFPNGTLLLRKTRNTDSGNYTVEIYSKDGKSLSKAVYGVYLAAPTVYGISKKSLFLYLKNKIQNNTQSIIWKKSDTGVITVKHLSVPDISKNSDTRYSVFEDGTLRLDDVEQNDTGSYTVEQSDGNKILDTEYFELIVFETDYFEEEEGQEGDSAELNPLPWRMFNGSHFVWKKDNSTVAEYKLESATCFKQFQNRCEVDGNGTLKLTRLQKDDGGIYIIHLYENGMIEEVGAVCLFISNTIEDSPIAMTTGTKAHLFIKASPSEKVYDIHWKKRDSHIAQLSGQSYNYYWPYKNRISVHQNGSVEIHKLKKDDSGEYSVEFFYKHGVKEKRIVSISVEDSLSRPTVKVQCLSEREVKFECLSNEYSGVSLRWLLNEETPVTNKTLNSKRKNNILLLRGKLFGNISCHVENKVSKNKSDVVPFFCEVFLTVRVIYLLVCLCSLVILLIIAFFILMCCKSQYKARQRCYQRQIFLNDEVEDDDSEGNEPQSNSEDENEDQRSQTE